MKAQFFVVAVTAGICPPWPRAYHAGEPIGFSDRAAAYAEAERLQADLDEDCDATRVYVLDVDGVPIRAAGVPKEPANYFLEYA